MDYNHNPLYYVDFANGKKLSNYFTVLKREARKIWAWYNKVDTKLRKNSEKVTAL
jgi:hypothetical protein